ncbi:hypothetical protein GO988_11950 [Hymenobacter sp. HMF4947]|uniref:Uncharacterized protein n=1 Tax=Hymenobacter ginkgonis TaxID=2682976 RepID=A0A7K1TF55_9BACT|nr:hypothetical protein [Hymenobacter ginkgonis]MVN77039.1 hypothetical protein [Hymenobacter ginkgonis]
MKHTLPIATGGLNLTPATATPSPTVPSVPVYIHQLYDRYIAGEISWSEVCRLQASR